ncbi:VOC family protein [Thermodesulfobacteriota bacterium]
MFNRINHIGIVVSNIEDAVDLFSKLFGFESRGPIETLPDMDIRDIMVSNGDVTLELMEPLGPESSMGKFLEKNGEGLHHISLEVDDITQTFEDLSEKGVSLVGKEPVTLDDAMLGFVHPRSTKGVLIEMIQPLIKK